MLACASLCTAKSASRVGCHLQQSAVAPSSFLLKPRTARLMATANGKPAKGDGVKASSKGGDEDCGFTRPEMYTEKLVGSVKEYDTHVFAVVEKDPSQWPKFAETPDVSVVAAKLAEALKGRKKDIPRQVKLTSVYGKDEGGVEGDVLLMPDMLKFTGLTPEQVNEFIDEALVGSSDKKLKAIPIEGDQLFVCVHGTHDKRCGVCGPPLIDEFRKEIQKRGIMASVWPCSHIGGHKFAGNMIAYTRRPDGTVAGEWYGYVTPKDVPSLLDAFEKGEVVDKLWRGGINLSPEAQEEALAKRQEGCGSGCQCVPQPIEPPPPSPESANSWFVSPSKWDSSTKLAVGATVAGVAALAAAWYLRSQRPPSS